MNKILIFLAASVLFFTPQQANALWIKYVCNTIVSSSDGGYWENDESCTIVDSGGHELPQEAPERIFIQGEIIYKLNNRVISKEQAKSACNYKNDTETASCVFGTELAQAGGIVACFKVVNPIVFVACEFANAVGWSYARHQCTKKGIEQKQVCDAIGQF